MGVRLLPAPRGGARAVRRRRPGRRDRQRPRRRPGVRARAGAAPLRRRRRPGAARQAVRAPVARGPAVRDQLPRALRRRAARPARSAPALLRERPVAVHPGASCQAARARVPDRRRLARRRVGDGRPPAAPPARRHDLRRVPRGRARGDAGDPPRAPRGSAADPNQARPRPAGARRHRGRGRAVMEFEYAFKRSSSVANRPGSTELSFSPDTRREPTYFSGELRKGIAFREAISALHDVVVSDLRWRPKDKTAYKEWAARQEAIDWDQVAAQRAGVARQMRDLQDRLAVLRRRASERRGPYDRAKRAYFDYLYQKDRDAWFVLDPVITVHPDEVFFECFSQDESSYGRLGASYDVFRNIGDLAR